MGQADVDALEALVRAWDDAMNSGNVDATMALYVDDNPMAMPPHAPLGSGAAGVREVIEGMHALGKVTVRDEFVDAEVSGDLAVMHGTFTLSIVPEGGDTVDDAGKWVCVCRREPDGSWKARYNIWNSDNPLPD